MSPSEIRQVGSVVVLVGVPLSLLSFSIAMWIYPGGYEFFGHFLSDLGRTNTIGGSPNPSSSLLFMIALAIIICVSLIFWVLLADLYHQYSTKTGVMVAVLISVFAGLSALPFLAAVALVPMDGDPSLHDLVAMIYFGLTNIALLFSSVLMITSSVPPLKKEGTLGLLFTVLVLVILELLIPSAIVMQKFIVAGYVVWIMFVGARLFSFARKKKEQSPTT